MYRKLNILAVLILACVTASAQFQNVVVGLSDFPNEPSITFNPKDPSYMVAGANTELYYYSQDAGLTWNEGHLTSPYGVWGDPCILVDTAGSFYFFHLSNPSVGGDWLDRIVCQKSADDGQTWNGGSYMGLNGVKDQDKEWTAVDQTNNHIYATWTEFDSYGSINPGDSSRILFSRSTDAGASWSSPIRINTVSGDCLDMDNTVEGAVPAVGPNGEICVSWAGPAGLVFTKSTDGGLTWPSANVFVSDIPGGWDYAIPGIYRANGLPVTCCDLSNGPHRGTIYINWSDQRNGLTDTDVFLSRSTDGGSTWSAPLRVNDDPPGKQQFFTWMTVDQVTGYLYIVFYDRRNYQNNLTDVYMAVSKDGGETFQNMMVSDTPFNPNSSVFFGDYTNIAAHNNIVRPIWTRLDNYNLSIVTAIVDTLFAGISPGKENNAPVSLEQNYPNPVSTLTHFVFKLRTGSRVTLKVYDFTGKEVASVINNRFLPPGKYIESFDISSAGLAPGFYFFSLVSMDKSLWRKMIVD
jgi:hypothetical protein